MAITCTASRKESQDKLPQRSQDLPPKQKLTSAGDDEQPHGKKNNAKVKATAEGKGKAGDKGESEVEGKEKDEAIRLEEMELEIGVMRSHGLNHEKPVLKVLQAFSLNSSNTYVPVKPVRISSIRHPIQTDLEITPGSNVKFNDGLFMRVKSIEMENNSTILVGQVMFPVGQISPDLPLDRCSTAWAESHHANISDPIFYPYSKTNPLAAQELALLVRDLLPFEQDHGLGDDKWRRPSTDLARDTPNIFFTNRLDKHIKFPMGDFICRMKKREGVIEGTGLLKPVGRYQYLSRRCALVNVEFLQPHEADKGHEVAASGIRGWFRSEGDATPLELQDSSTTIGTDYKAYTAIDGFCGAGGVSQGMKNAGIDVIAAFDQDEKAVETYSLTMPQTTEVSCEEVSNWTEAARRRRERTAFLHLSCPCQPFSPAHTVRGKDDMVNRDCLLTIGLVVDSVRPRILSLEQTFGMIEDRNQLWFTALRSQLVERGYSLQLKIVDMRNHGVAQRRQRLIVIASAPGELLPSFPEPSTPQEKRRLSIEDVLDPLYIAIKAGQIFQQHNPQFSPSISAKADRKQPVDTLGTQYGKWPVHWQTRRNKQSKVTMRKLTIQEGKLAQGFDLDFTLPDLNYGILSRQIGNAVPPPFAKDLFQHLIAHLRTTDAANLLDTSEKLFKEVENQIGNPASCGGRDPALSDPNEESTRPEDEFEGFDTKPLETEEQRHKGKKYSFIPARQPSGYTSDSELEIATSRRRFSDIDGDSSSMEQYNSRKKVKRHHRHHWLKSNFKDVYNVKTVDSEDDRIRRRPEDNGVKKITKGMGELSSPSK